MAVYGMADSCYEYDASDEEVCVSPEPRAPRPRLPQHDEARHVLDATEEISAILMQKLEGFQEDLRLYQWEKSRSHVAYVLQERRQHSDTVVIHCFECSKNPEARRHTMTP